MNRFVAQLSAGVLGLFGSVLVIFATDFVVSAHSVQAASYTVDALPIDPRKPATLYAATFDNDSGYTLTITPTPTLAPNVHQLQVPAQAASINGPRISEDGGVVFYDDRTNVFLATTDGLHGRAITAVQSGICIEPYPSEDGNLVAMKCSANVTGQNPDGNGEIVLRDLIHDQYIPITISGDTFTNHATDIGADGSSVLFTSDANWAGKNLEAIDELFLFHGGQYNQASEGGFEGNYAIEPGALSRDGNLVGYVRLIRPHEDSAFLLYDARTGQTTEPVACHPMGGYLFTRDGKSLVYAAGTTCDGTLTLPLRIYIERFGNERHALLEFSTLDQGYVREIASNTDGSRIVMIVKYNTPDALTYASLFTASGSQQLPEIPADASALTFDGVGRKLVFVSQKQLFVADLALDSDTPTPTSTPTPALARCLGDCDASGDVTVNELITMVNIALGSANISLCAVGDADSSGTIEINEIIAAVNNALASCSAS